MFSKDNQGNNHPDGSKKPTNLNDGKDEKEIMRMRRELTMKNTFDSIKNYKPPEKVEEEPLPKRELTKEEILAVEEKKKNVIIDSFINSLFQPSIRYSEPTNCTIDNFYHILHLYLEQEKASNTQFMLICKVYITILSKLETLQIDYMINVFNHCKTILEGGLYYSLMSKYFQIHHIDEYSIGTTVFSIYEYVEYTHYLTNILQVLYNQSVLYNTLDIFLTDLFKTLNRDSKRVYRDLNMNKMQICYTQLLDILTIMPESYEYIKKYFVEDLQQKNGLLLQNFSFFGPLLGFHPASPNVSIQLFQNNLADKRGFLEVRNRCYEVMNGLSDYHASLFKILKLLLKSFVTKDTFLNWIKHIIILNTDYLKTKYDRNKLSSFGFLATLAEFLYTIIEPLQKALTKIDIHYFVDPISEMFNTEDRLDIHTMEWYTSKEQPKEELNQLLCARLNCPNTYNSATLYFCYYCALYARVFIPLFENLERSERYLYSICPDGIEYYSYTNADQHRSFVISYIIQESIFYYIITSSYIYMNITTVRMISTLILNEANIHNTDQLTRNTNDIIRCLPARLFSILLHANKCIAINMKQNSRHKIIPDPSYYSSLLVLIAYFLNQDIPIHILANLTEVLYSTYLPSTSQDSGASISLSESPQLPHYIIPSLISVYGNVGTVGDTSIGYRRQIACFLREVWNMKGYHEDIINIKDNQDNIINFAYGLISTFSSLIAETFSSIPRIKAMYKEINTEEFNKLTEEERDDKIQELKRTENRVTNSFLLADETLKLFKDAAQEWHEVWMDDKLRDFLASSLATILAQLVGKEGTDLKLEDPSKYHFNPNEFLSLLIQVILCFNQDDQFAISILNSGQNLVSSFKKAERIVKRLHLLDSTDLASLHTFIRTLNKESEVVQDLTELIDEAPPEYIDIISGDFMKDPVKLPVTNQILDRTTIEHALLNNPINPFNRQPLTKEELIPRIFPSLNSFIYLEPELKEEIMKWLKDHNATL